MVNNGIKKFDNVPGVAAAVINFNRRVRGLL
jgi:hypothetical protein